MSKAIWSGRGDAEGMVYFSKDNGELVGRPYLRRRAFQHLSTWRGVFSVEQRKAAVAATIGNDEWLRFRNGETVGSVLRQVVTHLLTH